MEKKILGIFFFRRDRMLENEYYSIEELINLLGLKERQSYKASRKVKQYSEGMKIEDKIWIDHWFYDRSRYEYN